MSGRLLTTETKKQFFPEQSEMVSALQGSSGEIQRLFYEWPPSIQRTGMLVTAYGETVPFVNYMLSGSLLLLDRGVPDVSGARRVIIPFDQIVTVKIVDAIEMARFTAMGFKAPVEPRRPTAPQR